MTAVMIALRFDTPKYHSGGVSDVLGQGFPMSWNQTPLAPPNVVAVTRDVSCGGFRAAETTTTDISRQVRR